MIFFFTCPLSKLLNELPSELTVWVRVPVILLVLACLVFHVLRRKLRKLKRRGWGSQARAFIRSRGEGPWWRRHPDHDSDDVEHSAVNPWRHMRVGADKEFLADEVREAGICHHDESCCLVCRCACREACNPAVSLLSKLACCTYPYGFARMHVAGVHT